MKTSLKLSQWLKERGFEKDGEGQWIEFQGSWIPAYHLDEYAAYLPEDGGVEFYDILNDLCVKYAIEIWGEEMFCGAYTYDKHTHSVLIDLQQGKQDEAEEYIIQNCILGKQDV